MTCPYCNIFYGMHKASCKMLKYENENKPTWLRRMESTGNLRISDFY
jgi:hypothetical protein